MGACNDDFGKGSHCHVSHSATPEDHPQDAMSQEGKSGMVTESKVNDFLAEKFLAHIVLKKGAHYKINVRCTLASDPAQITEETVEVDPTPTTEECTSSTLKLLGTCKKLTFSSAANAPDKPRLQRVGNNKNKKRPQPISPMEQAKSNELQAKMDTGAENKEAHADANTMENEDRDKCPVSHLDGVEKDSDKRIKVLELEQEKHVAEIVEKVSRTETLEEKIINLDTLQSDSVKLGVLKIKLESKTNSTEKKIKFFNDNNECDVCEQSIEPEFKKTRVPELESKVTEIGRAHV
jgi:hypothetical protein